jgi:hypothetical protein
MEMGTISLKAVSLNSKVALLKGLGFNSDGEYVLDSEGNKVIDKYIDIPVRVENMVILPGSTIILDDNELSIMKYMEETGDDF